MTTMTMSNSTIVKPWAFLFMLLSVPPEVGVKRNGIKYTRCSVGTLDIAY